MAKTNFQLWNIVGQFFFYDKGFYVNSIGHYGEMVLYFCLKFVLCFV